MSAKRLVIACSVGVFLGIVGVVAYGYVRFNSAVAESLRRQAALNAAAKPAFDAAVTSKLKVGDSLEHAQEVLRSARLEFSVERRISPARLDSILRTGDSCGFRINLELDAQDRISKMDIREVFTGP